MRKKSKVFLTWPHHFRPLILSIVVFWTLIIGSALWREFSNVEKDNIEDAFLETKGAFEKDFLYRRWVQEHGGVYVPITDDTPPNPNLSHVEERDITTPSGKRLTLINAAYMGRQVHEMEEKNQNIRSHLTSLKPIRPENAPDPWERAALEAFERGETEVRGIADIDGEAFMRLMRPLVIKELCLKCHANQGYSVGDIRGGISASTSMKGHEAHIKKMKRFFLYELSVIWILGLVGIAVADRRISVHENSRNAAEKKLRKHHMQLEQLIEERTTDLRRTNRELENEITERKRVEEALRESETKFRGIYEQSPIAIELYNQDGELVDANSECLAMFGVDSFEAVKDFELFEDPNLPADTIKKLIAGESVNYESEFDFEKIKKLKRYKTSKSGKSFISVRITPLKADGGFLGGYLIQVTDITEHKQAEEALREAHDKQEERVLTRTEELNDANLALRKRSHDLGERVKELNCLYGLFKLVQRLDISLEEIYQGTVDLIPASWQYPDITCARLKSGDKTFKAGRFKATGWKQSEDIKVHGEKVGTIEVFYRKKMPELDEGPFVKEERNLINALAEQLGNVIKRKRAEKKLHQYSHIVSSSSDMLALLSKEYIYVAANYVYLQGFNLTSEQLIGNTVSEVFGEEFFNTIIKPNANRCLAGEEVNYQAWFDFPALGKRYMDITYYPYIDAENKIQGFVVCGRNATEHKQAEEALRESAEMLNEAQQLANLGSWSWIVETDIVRWSEELYNITGLNPQKPPLLYTEMHSLYTKKSWENLSSAMKKTVTTGEPYDLELDIVRPDGQVRHTAAQGKAIKDESGRVISLNGTVLDITERKHLEHQLIRSERLAATGQLAASVAHEINSPLQVITSMVSRMFKKAGEDAELIKNLDLLKAAFENIRDTVKNLLDLNRQGMELKRPTEINRVIEKTADLFRSHLKKNRVKLHLNLSSKVPGLKASPQQMSQLFLNLINNAVEAMCGDIRQKNGWRKRTSEDREITINTNLRRGNIVIKVSDRGPGISEKDLEHVFDPFYTRKKRMGMGVGLSICHGIVEDHGGTIGVKNSPEGGAMFTIILPVK